MPLLIALSVFMFTLLIFIPANWLEENIVRRRLINVPKTAGAKAKFSITRLTPVVTNVMSLLNIKITQEKRRQMGKNIELAGEEDRFTVEDFMALKVLLGLFLPIYLLTLWLISKNTMLLYLAVFTVPIGYLVPDQWIKSKLRQRQAKIKKELPYMLNAIAIMSEAGLNLVPALQEFSKRDDNELAGELKKVVQDISVGHSQVVALERMGERCQVDEVNRFISALSQSIERGSSGITKVLRDQASEVWETRKKNAQQLGEQASMKLFLPLLILALPATGIFILGPAMITIIDFIINF